jgi:hypothetical protein
MEFNNCRWLSQNIKIPPSRAFLWCFLRGMEKTLFSTFCSTHKLLFSVLFAVTQERKKLFFNNYINQQLIDLLMRRHSLTHTLLVRLLFQTYFQAFPVRILVKWIDRWKNLILWESLDFLRELWENWENSERIERNLRELRELW